MTEEMTKEMTDVMILIGLLEEADMILIEMINLKIAETTEKEMV